MSPRQECDVKESFETYQDCGVIPVDKFPSTRCSNQIREVPREVCQDIAVTRFKEECEDVTKMIPTIACETKMKPIELKEICVDIEIQLPREECRSQEKEVCRYEPRQEIIQRCEPTVKEVCHSTQETVCQQQCVSNCEEKERKMCMTIPHQECKEVLTPVCQQVSRRQCDLVPQETCQEVAPAQKSGDCMTNTRLECQQIPRQQCGTSFKSVCQKKPTSKCSDTIKNDCKMNCSPVFWCKVDFALIDLTEEFISGIHIF